MSRPVQPFRSTTRRLVTTYRPHRRNAAAIPNNVIAPTTSGAALEFFKSEQERYGKLAKKANITLD